MLDPAKIVPPLAVLIFVGAMVSLLWGDQFGIASYLRGIPPYVYAVIVLVAVLINWRFGSRQYQLGWVGWLLAALAGIFLVYSLVAALF